MMDNYEAISGMAPKGSKGANFNQNNFSAWVPHAIVVALGTNDGSAWGRDAVTDPETGETFRNTPEIFEAKAFEFLVKLRKYNPTALLAWLFYEQDTNGVNQILDRVIAKYRRERDENCLIFRIQQFAVKEGANGHPSREQHEEWASQVVEKLGPILKGLK
jgi:lysophospholipase L1-like esterase